MPGAHQNRKKLVQVYVPHVPGAHLQIRKMVMDARSASKPIKISSSLRSSRAWRAPANKKNGIFRGTDAD